MKILAAANPFQQCTPSHCTWGEIGQMYTSKSVIVGFVAIAIIFLVARRIFKRVQ